MPSVSLCCPKCDAILKMASLPAEGKKIKCTKCGAIFVAADHEVMDAAEAVKSKPERPVPASSKGRPARKNDDDEDSPRSRKPRAVEEEDDDDRPRRSKARRDPDEEEEDTPRRKLKKKPASNSGLVLMLCLGGGVLLLAATAMAGGLWWLLSARPQVQMVQAPAPNLAPIGAEAQAKGPEAAPVIKKDPEAPKAKEEPKTKPKIRPNPKPKADPEPEVQPAAPPVDLDKDLLDKTARATVFIRVNLGNLAATGSGFLVKTSGDTAYIITNFHVIALEQDETEQPKGPFGKKGPKGPPMIGPKKKGSPFGQAKSDPKTGPKVTVVLYSGTPEEQSLSAEVVAVDQEGDLAALRVTGARNLPEALDVSQDTDVAETQPVYIFGFPAKYRPKGPGNPPITVGKGKVTTLRRDANNEIIDVHIDGELNPGNSGGPVVDAQGRLVGVAVSTVVGKQIGFAIPTGELLQMFKGRLYNGIVYQLKLQGTRVDALGEVWVHDRKSFVRARNNIAVQLADAPKGSQAPLDEFRVVAILADPMLKISGATAYFAITENVPTAPGEMGWAKLDKATAIPLKIEDQAARGVFKLPQGAVPDQTFAFQFSYVNADKKTVFTQPHLVRLTFPKNTKSVTINIAGIPDEPTQRYLEETTPKLFEGKVRIKEKSKGSMVLEIDPVPDPSVIGPKITFGTVTSVEGRTFNVTAKKIDLPMPDAAEVSILLDELKLTDMRRRIGAADKFGKMYGILPARRAEVAKALEAQVDNKDIWLVNAALRGLMVWGGPDNIPPVLIATDHGLTRGQALHFIAKFKTPEAAAALAKFLPSISDRAFVVSALKGMGPVAEKAVIPYVSNKDIWAAQEACRILKEIGSAECIPALTEVANGTNGFVNAVARDALLTVKKRTKA